METNNERKPLTPEEEHTKFLNAIGKVTGDLENLAIYAHAYGYSRLVEYQLDDAAKLADSARRMAEGKT